MAFPVPFHRQSIYPSLYLSIYLSGQEEAPPFQTHQVVQSLHLLDTIMAQVQLLQIHQLLETFDHCQAIALQ